MRETTNRTPAWVYVVSVVSAVALGLGTIAIADYLRPSKRAARQAAELRPEWKEEVLSAIEKSAKSEHDLYELVMKYNEEWREWIRLFDKRMQDIFEENRSIPPSETEVKYSYSEGQLSAAARAFVMAYPRSKHYDRVESLLRETSLRYIAASIPPVRPIASRPVDAEIEREEIEQIVRDLRRERSMRQREAEKAAMLSRYRNNEWRTEAEGYFFKGIKYAIGDGVSSDFRESVRNFRLARDLAGLNDINELERMLNYNYFSAAREAWNRSIHRLPLNW